MKRNNSRFYLILAVAVLICGVFLLYRVTKQTPTQAQTTEKTQATKATKATASKKPQLQRARPYEHRSIGKSLLKPNLILI